MRIPSFLLAGVLFLGVAGAAAETGEAREGSGRVPPPFGEPSPDGLPLHLILALDGIPFDVFSDLQQRGSFADFHPAARMVSTFPSLSDVALSAISGSDPPEGYQVMRFDRDSNRVTGNTFFSLSGKAHGHLPADTRVRSSMHRVWSYLASYRSAREELRQMRRDFLGSRRMTFVGYIEATDPLLHVHGRRKAERFLVDLDRFLAALEDEVRARTGRGLAIDLVSDHGSTLRRGRKVRLEKALRRCEFRRVRHLQGPQDVAYAQAGIIGSVAMACDPDRIEQVASCLLADPGVDLVSFVRNGAVVILSGRGEAHLRRIPGEPERYGYRTVSGDPLDLTSGPSLAPVGEELVATREDWFRFTVDGVYPDPLARLWHAFHGAVREPSEILVSLGDGFEFGNRFVRFLAFLRGRKGTHGSLTSAASMGILASNWREVEDSSVWMVRELLFGENYRRPPVPPP